ncbi:hypothetical protein B0H15DRAFT_865510 [Mycena belliarum]|uniref:AMP-dependent synthetase/ligase domain-containing protein n=1 Tax=Mycena belliarum TaxID=1033014 RepID=A0AAD6XJN1_9AGAR|nr:hypothetical protein B0H15DRAFT_865510 [Mycena belliae]
MALPALLPPVLCPQAVNSATFRPPKATSLTLPEICDWHYEHSGSHSLYIQVDDATNEVSTIPWRTAVRGVYRISHSVSESVKSLNIPATRPTIGLCSTCDPFTYLLSILGIMRAGYPVFLMSPWASPAALKHLISISGVPLILTNADDPDLRAKLLFAAGDTPGIQISDHLPWSRIISTEPGPEKGPDIPEHDLEATCIILHSSGSTTLPRLNVWTHRMVATALWQPWYGERDICGEIMCAASVPMSGAAGTMLALFPASSGLIVSGLKPQSPPSRLSSESVWKAIVATKSTYAFILQPFIYTFSADGGKRKILAQLKGVIFGGGPLRKTFGDQLALDGVNLLTFFGSSEGGLMTKVVTDNRGEDWEYFSFYPLVNPGFIPQENSDLFEFVVKTGPFHRPTQTNTVFEGVAAFASKDLLQRHPEKPSFWKYVCRMDDQEMLSNGVKINAAAFEAILTSDPLIRGTVIFSQGPTYGVIVDTVSEYAPKSDPSHPEEKAKLRSLIWPTVERFNQVVPDLARLKEETILFTTPEKPFVYGEKGLPRRKEAIRAYIHEIEAYVGPWAEQ